MNGAYIVGGYPDLETYIEVLKILKDSKFDFVEIGLPFNDPVADGPVIAKAIDETVKKRYRVNEILDPAREILKDKELYVMTYCNFVYNYSPNIFEGFDGLIIADCPNRFHSFFYKRGLNIPIIPFVTPETREKDLKLLKNSKGNFIYFIGLRGTTGGKIDFSQKDNFKLIEKVKNITNKKVVWGFGIKNKAHIKEALSIADGVIIGTEIVKVQNNIEKLKIFLKSLEF